MASKKNTIPKAQESDLFVDRNHEEVNKTTEEVFKPQNLVDDDGHDNKGGLSDNLNGFDRK